MGKLYLILAVASSGLLTSTHRINQQKNLLCDRMNYFFELKKRTANKFWKDFNSRSTFGPMILYTGAGDYLINPNEALLRKLNFSPIDHCIDSVIYGKVTGLKDEERLNMQVDYDEEDSSLTFYKNAIANISDIDIARKFIPNIRDLEFWIGMVMHENFHLYQTSYTKFKNCQNETQEKFQRDTLISFYKNLPWYKQSIQKENGLLLAAIRTNDKDSVRRYLNEHLQIIKARQSRILWTYKIDIAPLEDMLERSEGVARYIEYSMKRMVKEIPVQKKLEGTDTTYHFGAYNSYTRESDDVMTGVSNQYYYATGLNLAILFEKYKVNYQETMYKDNVTFRSYFDQVEVVEK